MDPRRGQAFISLILFIGSMVLLVGVTLSLFANSFVDAGYGYQASVQAEAIASSGAQDALVQLNRNPSFASAGYTVSVGSSTATVVVTQSATTSQATILSTATTMSRTKKVSVVVGVNTSTNQINIVSWQTIQ